MPDTDPIYVPPEQPPLVEFVEPEKPTADDTVAPMPVWASILVILLSLSAGGWIVKWYVGTDMLQHESMVLDQNPPAVATRGWGNFAVPAVRQAGNDRTIIHSPEANLTIFHSQRKAPRIDTLTYVAPSNLVPAATRNTLQWARTIVDPKDNWKTTLNLTDSQVKTLRSLSPQIYMMASAIDRDHLLALYNAYDSAKDKTKPLADLLAAITDVARRSVGPTRDLANERAAKIKSTLTDDQWRQFTLKGGPRPPGR